jgi:hypothetical protein
MNVGRLAPQAAQPPQPQVHPQPQPQNQGPGIQQQQQQQEQRNDACFAVGTKLLSPEGPKAIEEFKVGDPITSRSEYEPGGPLEVKLVEEVFRHSAPILHLHVDGKLIRTTGKHPFFAYNKGWVNANELAVGDYLLTDDGQWAAVEDVFDTGEWEVVYNLRIADYHTYFVTDWDWGFSVWAHNACVVKGGTGTAWRIDTFEEPRNGGIMITGSSASSEPGKTVAELSVGIPNGQVRVTTTEAIAAAGGAVVPSRRTPANPHHVTITGLTVAQLDAVFGPPVPNPSRAR